MASAQFALLLFICLHGSGAALQVHPKIVSNGDICQECVQIFEDLADLLSNADLQKKMIDGIENVCDHLPGPSTGKLCKQEVEKIFPLAVSFLTVSVKPQQVCALLGLCGPNRTTRNLLTYVSELLQAAVARDKGQPTTQCSLCILLLQTLESIMPKEKAEVIVLDLLGQICVILPSTYRQECGVLIGKYGRMLLDPIFLHATPQSLCTLVRMCRGQEDERCVLKTHICRDVETALECGTLQLCQRFIWKVPSNSTR